MLRWIENIVVFLLIGAFFIYIVDPIVGNHQERLHEIVDKFESKEQQQ